jgi:hypothetical protein
MTYPVMTLAPPPSYDSLSTNQPNFDKLAEFCERKDIPKDTMEDLKLLVNWNIVFICDDSGSMENKNEHGHKTRWEELKETVMVEIELATCLDSDGADIYFLNRPAQKNITEVAQVVNAFGPPPKGKTPMGATIEAVIRDKYGAGKPLLIVIATDGIPSDLDERAFFDLIKTRGVRDPGEQEVRQDRIRFGFLACTDDDAVMKSLRKLDRKINGVDVLDDYRSEKKKADHPKEFNRAKYIAKGLLGPILQKWDN